MLLRSKIITEETLAEMVKSVSASYDNNIGFRTGPTRIGPTRIRFTLRNLGGLCGAAGSRNWRSHGSGPRNLRKTTSACYHAHAEMFAAIFAMDPNAKIVTSFFMARKVTVTRENLADWLIQSRDIDVGTLASPMFAEDLCECGV